MNKSYKDVTIIGTGKIASSIVPALKNSGYIVSNIISRDIGTAEKFAGKYGIKSYSDKYAGINNKSGLVLLCIPDSAINSTARLLAKEKLNFSSKIFIHLSGALDISCLNTLKKKNGQTASFHIMQTFPSKKRVSIKGCYAAIETADNFTEKILFELAGNLRLKPFRLNGNSKTLYHLAGVFTSNFLIGNLFSAETAFKNTGSTNVNFAELVFPIIYSTLANIKKSGIAESLSGPIERGDINTVKKHLFVLKKYSSKAKDTSLLQSYIAQSLNLLRVTEMKNGHLNDVHKKIKALLNSQ